MGYRSVEAFDAVLFDFNNTLFRAESVADSVRAALQGESSERAMSFTEALIEARATGPMLEMQQLADQGVASHRSVVDQWIDTAGLPRSFIEPFHRRLTSASAWRAFGAARAVLGDLQAARLPVGIVSNVCWDIRPVFRQAGLHDLITDYVLSFELGYAKPNAGIFLEAAMRVQAEPARMLHVGDNPRSDGPAGDVGMAVYLIPDGRNDLPGGLWAVADIVLSTRQGSP